MERTIGILKRHWPCLKLGLQYSVEKNVKVIIACVVLLNFAMMRGECYEEAAEDQEREAQPNTNSSSSNMNARYSRAIYIQLNFA